MNHFGRLVTSCGLTLLRGVTHQQTPLRTFSLLRKNPRLKDQKLLLPCLATSSSQQRGMKVKTAIKKRCAHCRIEKRLGRWHVICEVSPRHNQRQKGRLPPPELEYFPYFFREQGPMEQGPK